MVLERPEATAGAPKAAAKRRTARERLCCAARNDGAAVRGRKSRCAVALSAVEAKPSFGPETPIDETASVCSPPALDLGDPWPPCLTARGEMSYCRLASSCVYGSHVQLDEQGTVRTTPIPNYFGWGYRGRLSVAQTHMPICVAPNQCETGRHADLVGNDGGGQMSAACHKAPSCGVASHFARFVGARTSSQSRTRRTIDRNAPSGFIRRLFLSDRTGPKTACPLSEIN